METKLIQRRLSAYFFWAENSKKSGGLSCSLIFLFGRSLEVRTQLVQVQRHGSCLLAISRARKLIAQTTHPLGPLPRTFL